VNALDQQDIKELEAAELALWQEEFCQEGKIVNLVSAVAEPTNPATALPTPKLKIEVITRGIVRITHLASSDERDAETANDCSSIWLKKQGTWTLQFRRSCKGQHTPIAAKRSEQQLDLSLSQS